MQSLCASFQCYLSPHNFTVRPLDLGGDITDRISVEYDVRRNCKLFEKRIQTLRIEVIGYGIA